MYMSMYIYTYYTLVLFLISTMSKYTDIDLVQKPTNEAAFDNRCERTRVSMVAFKPYDMMAVIVYFFEREIDAHHRCED